MAAQQGSMKHTYAQREQDLNIIAGQSGLVKNFRQANEALSKDLFVLENRIANVLHHIGFSELDEFEAEVHAHPELWKLASINGNHLETSPKPVSRKIRSKEDQEGETTRNEFEELKRQVNLLRIPLSDSRKVNLKQSSGQELPSSSEIAKLRKDLEAQRLKYDTLLKAKEASEKKYKADYKKWRAFKKWILGQTEHGTALQECLNDGQLDVSFGTSPPPSSATSMRSPFLSRSKAASPNILAREVRQEGSLSDLECLFPQKSPRRTRIAGSSPHNDAGPSSLHRTKRQPPDADKEMTINALFAIESSRNGGIGHQFDEVVRGKARAHLDAGDCDCCKEYYSRLEPMPTRLRPPQWGSQTVENTSRVSPVHSDTRKKEISRHRHRWTPPQTPPDYWNIGFPTTQEVEDINRKAADLHTNKRRRIEEEASKEGGRYVRRKEY